MADKGEKKLSKDKEGKKIYRKLRNSIRKNGGLVIEGIDESKHILDNSSGGVGINTTTGEKVPVIMISGKSVGNAATLSHELGHNNYHLNPKSDKIGRYSHKLYNPKASSIGGIGVGFASGIRSAKKESEGEKEGVANRIAGGATAVGLDVPILIAEGKASRHGLKLLKNAGASDKYLKSSRKSLRNAWLTYGAKTVADVGLSELGRAAGRAYYNNILKEDKTYSEKETKLKLRDRMSVLSRKHFDILSSRDRARKYLKGEVSTPYSPENAMIYGAIAGGPVNLFVGGPPMIHVLDGKYKQAAIASGIGALTNPAINKLVGHLNKEKLKKNPHSNDKDLDIIDVAEGKMSKADFAKKWYKS